MEDAIRSHDPIDTTIPEDANKIKQKKYKGLLIGGIVFIQIAFWALGLLGKLLILFTIFSSYLFLFLFLGYVICAFIVIRVRKTPFGVRTVLRFAIASCIGLTLFVLIKSVPLSYASIMPIFDGVLLGVLPWWTKFVAVGGLKIFLLLFCYAGGSFFVAALVTKTLPKVPTLLLVRCLLLTAIASIIIFIGALDIGLDPRNTYPSLSPVVYIILFPSLIGVVYYYVVASFMGDVRFFGKMKLEKHAFTEVEEGEERQLLDGGDEDKASQEKRLYGSLT